MQSGSGEGEANGVAQDADMEKNVDGYIITTEKAGRESGLRGKIASSILCWVRGDGKVSMWTNLVDAGVWGPRKIVAAGIKLMAEAMGMGEI